MTSRRTAPGQDGPATVAPQPRMDSADPPVEVEPTTGAPVDAVPRRVPVRQHRWRQEPAPGGTADDSDGGVFWAPIEEVHWDGTPLRDEPRRGERPPAATRRAPARASHPRDPLSGLAVLLVLSLLAAFFAWVSASPFWLAVGHSTGGTVTITSRSGDGLTQRCRGVFLADGDRFVAHGVRVSGVPAGRDVVGTVLRARMTGPDGGTAYADSGVGRHLRWLLGLLLVAACAAGIARWTGATRLPDPRHRRWAVVAALTGPLLVTAGFLAAAW